MERRIVVRTTPHFDRAFRRLSGSVQERAIARDRLFRSDPFHPLLHTHQLHGALAGLSAYSVDAHHRVLFRFIDTDTVLYYDIGTHRVYR